LLASNKKFFSEFFTIEFFQFKLDAISPVSVGLEAVTQIKMEVYERSSCVSVTIATRDGVTGEKWLKCKR